MQGVPIQPGRVQYSCNTREEGKTKKREKKMIKVMVVPLSTLKAEMTGLVVNKPAIAACMYGNYKASQHLCSNGTSDMTTMRYQSLESMCVSLDHERLLGGSLGFRIPQIGEIVVRKIEGIEIKYCEWVKGDHTSKSFVVTIRKID